MLDKLKYIYLRFILIGCFFIIIYTFFAWLFFLKWDILNVNDEVIKFWLPICLPFIPLYFWLYPRVKLLRLNSKKGDSSFVYIVIAALAIGIPTIIAQYYIEAATGKLTKLNRISEINNFEKTKYYTVQHFWYNKGAAGIHLKSEVTGRNGQNLDFYVYFAVPIFDSITDTSKSNCVGWFGYPFLKSVNNNLSSSEEDIQFRQFELECIDTMNKKDLRKFAYLSTSNHSDDNTGCIKAAKESRYYPKNSTTPIILIPVNEQFQDRIGNKLTWIFMAFGIGGFTWLLMVMFAKLKSNYLETLALIKTGKKNKSLSEVIGFLIPQKGRFATILIVDINILVFILMVFSGLGFMSFESNDLLNWGANYRPYTENNQWWRLITNIFVHGGFVHILMNMVGLIFVSILLEPTIGTKRYLIVYLLCGTVASLTSLYFHTSIVSIGASGAIFGLYGVFFAFLLTKVYEATIQKALFGTMAIFIGYNLIFGFISHGIDNAAHIGGLLSGFLLGFLLTPETKRRKGGLEIEAESVTVESQKTDDQRIE